MVQLWRRRSRGCQPDAVLDGYPGYPVPCSGRIDAKLILAAFREGADGVWVSGCHPGECHYLEGNYYARRKFILLGNLLEHMGIDKDRVHFSWISSAEATKFAKVAQEVADTVVPLGASDRFVK